MYNSSWVVHVQPAPSGCEDPDAVLKYLARYVAGTAISDRRLISYDGQWVIFWVEDRERRQRFPCKLKAFEFTRRFMMHVLPKGFQRVRYRGLFHGAKRNNLLPKIRQQLAAQAKDRDTHNDQHARRAASQAATDAPAQPPTCPACGLGQLKKINSRDTPANWLQVFSASPFQPPASQWEKLDLADWTPVLDDDPPAPLRSLRQTYLPAVYHELPHDDARNAERCRGQPLTEPCPRAA
jgi:hypothetical protein